MAGCGFLKFDELILQYEHSIAFYFTFIVSPMFRLWLIFNQACIHITCIMHLQSLFLINEFIYGFKVKENLKTNSMCLLISNKNSVEKIDSFFSHK